MKTLPPRPRFTSAEGPSGCYQSPRQKPTGWGQGNAKGRKHRLGGKRAKLSQEEERKREALQTSREAWEAGMLATRPVAGQTPTVGHWVRAVIWDRRSTEARPLCRRSWLPALKKFDPYHGDSGEPLKAAEQEEDPCEQSFKKDYGAALCLRLIQNPVCISSGT